MPYNKESSKQYVDELRARTFCKICGAQPVEWHHIVPRAPGDGQMPIAHLRALGFPIPRIEAELLKCEALCRRCHMVDDDRISKLQTLGPRKKGETYVEPKPCSVCQRVVKVTRGGKCRACYDAIRRGKMREDGTRI